MKVERRTEYVINLDGCDFDEILYLLNKVDLSCLTQGEIKNLDRIVKLLEREKLK